MARKRQQFYEDVELLAGGGEGHAIAKVNGKVIFVKYGAPGDRADLRIIGRKKRHSIARIEKLHRSSSVRQEHFCKHYGVCGGCKWQHIQYQSQLDLKDQWARDCLQRIGKLEVGEYLPILGSEKTTHYRNKMEYTFSNKRWLFEGEQIDELEHTNGLGFHAPGRFDKVVDIEQCWLQDPFADSIRNGVRAYCIAHTIPFYDLKEHTGTVRNLMFRKAGDDWMVTLFVKQMDGDVEGLLNYIRDEFNPKSLNYAENSKRNDSIFDLDIRCYSGEDHLIEHLQGLSFKIHPKSFFQTNTEQADRLYDVAFEMAEISKEDIVYDLYCGTGTISLSAAKRARHVIGVEILEEAVNAARENAQLNAIENAHFICGDMKDVFHADFYEEHGAPDVIITDPPRAGMHPKVVEQLLNIACPRIVYISCNPATQARDLAVLSENYEVVRSRAVDMFPHTHHVENVVLLRLKN